MSKLKYFALFVLIVLTAVSCGPKQNDAVDDEKNEIPVEAYVVNSTSIDQTLPFTATLKPIHEVDLIAEVSGEVLNVIKELGDYVSLKDTLAYIEDDIPKSQYRQAQSQLVSAENNMKIAELNLKSDKDLFERGDISELAFEQSQLGLKAAKADYLSATTAFEQLKKGYLETRITSPIKGFVSRKYINLGTMVSPGMPVYHVVDISVLKCQISVAQALINRVHVGSKVHVTLSTLRNQAFDGVVKYISPQADERTGGFIVEIHIPNSRDFKIKAGVTAKVNLTISELGEQIVIPDHAVVQKNDLVYIYRVQKGKASLLEIKISEIVGNQMVIEEGLAIGDTIVVVGMENLGVETSVWIEELHNSEDN